MNGVNDFINFWNGINNFNNQMVVLFQNHQRMQANINQRSRRKYRYRKRFNPMVEYDDSEFKRRFRFSKEETREIYRLLNGAQTLEPTVFLFFPLTKMRYHNNKKFNFFQDPRPTAIDGMHKLSA